MTIISKIKRTRIIRKLKKDNRVVLGEKTYYRDDFRWDIREGTKGRHITVGESCIVAGYMVIENGDAHITIGDWSSIGVGTMIVAAGADVRIGNHVVISFNVTLYNTNSHALDYKERRHDVKQALDLMNGDSKSRDIHWEKIESRDIIIEDDVWIGFGATVLKGVTIGKGAIIGAKSVVTHDVEPFTVVAGNPAKVVKRIEFKGE